MNPETTRTGQRLPKLDHVAIRVSDLDASISFYEALGFAVLFRNVDEVHHEAFAFLGMDGANLELLTTLASNSAGEGARSPVPQEPFCPHIALYTNDLVSEMGRLSALGVELLKGPLEIAGQVRWVYFSDPDGNVLEYVEWI